MAKKWYDAGLIVEQEAEIETDKWEYERLMKQKPNFDKSKKKEEKPRKK